MGSGAQAAMADALARLWARFLPEMLERVRVLESAATALVSGSLTDEERAAAAAAAHKLAGVLGTFGLAEGTELAREAETVYPGAGVEQATRLKEIAERLEAMIRARW